MSRPTRHKNPAHPEEGRSPPLTLSLSKGSKDAHAPAARVEVALVPGLLAAAWWASAPENTTARGPDDMPRGWRELFDEMEREAYAALLAPANAADPPHFAQPNGEVPSTRSGQGDGGVS